MSPTSVFAIYDSALVLGVMAAFAGADLAIGASVLVVALGWPVLAIWSRRHWKEWESGERALAGWSLAIAALALVPVALFFLVAGSLGIAR